MDKKGEMPELRSGSVAGQSQASHDSAEKNTYTHKQTGEGSPQNPPNSPVMLHGDFDIVIKDINQNLRQVRAEFSGMQDQITRIEARLCRIEKDKISHSELDNEIGIMVVHFRVGEKAIKALEDVMNVEFDPKNTLIASGVFIQRNENIVSEAKQIVRSLNEPNISVIRAKRLESRDGRPGLVKIQLNTEDEKVKLLEKKDNLCGSQRFNKVRIRSSKSHVERLLEINCKMMIDELPYGREKYRITNNGRMIIRDSWRGPR